MTPAEHAENLISYFDRVDTRYPDEVWRLSLEIAREWLRLINAASISPSEVIALVTVVKDNKDRTSGWFDLALVA